MKDLNTKARQDMFTKKSNRMTAIILILLTLPTIILLANLVSRRIANYALATCERYNDCEAVLESIN